MSDVPLFLSPECPPEVIAERLVCPQLNAMKKYDDRLLISKAYEPYFLAEEEERPAQELYFERIRQAVDSLPWPEREFIYCFYFEGRSYTEIAESRGLNLKRVQKLHLRAKRRLRTVLMPILKESRNA